MGSRSKSGPGPAGGGEFDGDTVRPPRAGSEDITISLDELPDLDQESWQAVASPRDLVEATVLPQPIAKVGRFDVLGRVAVGGMGEIFLARETGHGAASRLLVLKLVKPEMSRQPDLVDLFLKEARVAMRLTHPNICHVYEVGQAAGRNFIAMEWVNGVTLKALLRGAREAKAPLPVPTCVKITAQVAEALDFAHRTTDEAGKSLGIVHRDVSPQNIMVSFAGLVKLLDFGVVKLHASATQSGTLKGKFGYMSPEQAMGAPVDARSDVFSLGICCFEMLCGRRLYDRSSEYETLKSIIERPIPPIRSARPDLPDSLAQIVHKALARRPAERFQSAAEFQEALEQFLAHERQVVNTARIAATMRSLYGDDAGSRPRLETGPEITESFTAPAAEVEALLAAPASAVRPRSGRRWLAPIAVGVALLLGAIGLWVAWPAADAVTASPATSTAAAAPPTDPPPTPASAPVVEAAGQEAEQTEPAEPALAAEQGDTEEVETPVAEHRSSQPSGSPPRGRHGRAGTQMRTGRFVATPGF